MAEEGRGNKDSTDGSEPTEQKLTVETEGSPAWRKIFREAFDKARREDRPINRSGLGRDHSRSLVLLAGTGVAVLLLFLVVFSSPNRRDKRLRSTPNLGQVPGQQTPGRMGSTTPLLSAQLGPPEGGDAGDVTARDVKNTARPIRSSPSTPSESAHPLPSGAKRRYALGRIDLSDLDAREHPSVPISTSRQEADDLRKPSLVFVRNAQNASAGVSARITGGEVRANLNGLDLPAGTRLLARLESVVTSALNAPVVAAIEYNYERDGEIVVPAGAKVLGSLQQADRSGNVGIRFHSIQMLDGTTEKIDATAMSLTYGPLKGVVSGKKTGTHFLVRTLTGLGQAATYLVGSGGLSAPLSESAFLRDRIATNIGIAGDQELNSLAFNQNIVVAIPGNTRFYVVMEQGTAGPETETQPAATRLANSAPVPSIEELRELLQLRQELSAMAAQSSSVPVGAPQVPPQ